jgi:phage tail-like protein
MARSTAFDAYEKFRFTVQWSDNNSDPGSAAPVLQRAGFHDVDTPNRSTTVGEYREGLDGDFPQLFNGLSRLANISMKRGATSSLDFYQWAEAVHNPSIYQGQVTIAGNQKSSLAAGAIASRKDLTVLIYDRSGVIVKAWKLINCLVVEFRPGDKLDSTEDNVKLMEELVVRPEDFYELQVADGVVGAAM